MQQGRLQQKQHPLRFHGPRHYRWQIRYRVLHQELVRLRALLTTEVQVSVVRPAH